MNFETLQIKIENQIAFVSLHRPEKANCLNRLAWDEIKQAFEDLDQQKEVRVIVLAGEGKHFCAGIDLELLAQMKELVYDECEGRKAEALRRLILQLQGSFSAIEKCRKPVIAAIQGACVGAGVDMISACDLRYCSQDASFSIKEIDMGMVADVGTLQRLPHIIPDGVMRELAYTGRKLGGSEAEKIGLVNRCFENPEILIQEVKKVATEIAEKSPLAIRGTKEMILYTRDHSVSDSLNYIATWNAGMLISNDILEAMMAHFEKRKGSFKD